MQSWTEFSLRGGEKSDIVSRLKLLEDPSSQNMSRLKLLEDHEVSKNEPANSCVKDRESGILASMGRLRSC